MPLDSLQRRCLNSFESSVGFISRWRERKWRGLKELNEEQKAALHSGLFSALVVGLVGVFLMEGWSVSDSSQWGWPYQMSCLLEVYKQEVRKDGPRTSVIGTIYGPTLPSSLGIRRRDERRWRGDRWGKVTGVGSEGEEDRRRRLMRGR